jgi:hypothetical protein
MQYEKELKTICSILIILFFPFSHKIDIFGKGFFDERR